MDSDDIMYMTMYQDDCDVSAFDYVTDKECAEILREMVDTYKSYKDRKSVV